MEIKVRDSLDAKDVSFTDTPSGMGDKVEIEFDGCTAFVWKSEFLRIAKMLAVPLIEDTPHD